MARDPHYNKMEITNNSQRKKDGTEGSNESHLETRSKAGEEKKSELMPVDVDNHADTSKSKNKNNPLSKKGKAVVPTEENKTLNKLRKNPFIVTTLALGLFCIIIIIGNVLEVNMMDKTENEILCSVIGVTPAWADSNGKLIKFGAIIPPTNMSVDLVGATLIPERVKFLYFPECSACQQQIDYFKEQGTWEDYLKEGLVINCQEVLK